MDIERIDKRYKFQEGSDGCCKQQEWDKLDKRERRKFRKELKDLGKLREEDKLVHL